MLSEAAAPAAAGASPFKLRQRAGSTAYLEKGAGEPLIFIHGVGMHAEAWRPQIESFSRTHRVIAIDMLGHGQSGPAPGSATIADYSRQIADLLDQLGTDSASIVGHSMGALISLSFALDWPDRCLRVAALNAVYCRDPEARHAVEARAAQLTAQPGPGDIEGPLRRWFGDRRTRREQESADQVRLWLENVQPAGYATAYRIFATGDRAFEERLEGLQVPALFMTGALDPNSTPAMSRAMAAAAPKGYAVVLEGSRHVMNLTDPDLVNAELQRWLALV